jgi:hypothetical protein
MERAYNGPASANSLSLIPPKLGLQPRLLPRSTVSYRDTSPTRIGTVLALALAALLPLRWSRSRAMRAARCVQMGFYGSLGGDSRTWWLYPMHRLEFEMAKRHQHRES